MNKNNNFSNSTKKYKSLFSILGILFFIAILIFIYSNSEKIKENTLVKTTNVDSQPLKAITKFVGGIQINEANQVDWAKNLKASGMNTAQVTAYAKQGIWNSDHIWWEDADTTNIISQIRAIKSQNINVIMVLRVALQHGYKDNPFKWHGMIFPKTKDQKINWFSQYNYWVEMWAKICEREGVELLAIGSELNALTATVPLDSLTPILNYLSNEESQIAHEFKVLKYQEQLKEKKMWEYGVPINENHKKYIQTKIESNLNWSKQVCYTNKSNNIELINADRLFLDSCWRYIINNTKEHYKGKLTLAANFDNYNEVNFWDELDLIGINAYFPLRKIVKTPISDTELYSKLKNGWDSVFQDINQFKIEQKIVNKPLFFTELGYSKKENCTTAPWQGYGYSLLSNHDFDTLVIWQDAENNPNERKLAVDALYEVVKENRIPLKGLSYWKLSSHDYHEEHEAFMLHLSEEITDSLQYSLSRFLKP